MSTGFGRVTLVLFRTRRGDECSRLKEGQGERSLDSEHNHPLGSLTFPLPPPNMSTQCPLRRNPLGKRFPITASSAKSAAGAWVWCTRRKT